MAEKKNIQGRAQHPVQVQFVAEAAKKAGVTLSQYVVQTTLRQAAKDLGRPEPVLPKDAIVERAAKAGMSRRQYEQLAAAEKALAEMRAELEASRSGKKLADVGAYEKPAVIRRRRAK